MNKKWLKISNVFFIVAFTVAIFAFSMGNSVLNSYQKRLERYDTEKNKLISFENLNEYRVKSMLELLKDEKITITLQYDINNGDEGYIVNTIIKNDGINILPDLKDGEYLTEKDYDSSNNIGVFSAGLTSEEVFKIKNTTTVGEKEYLIKRKGTTYTTRKELYVPKVIFFDLVNENNIALNKVYIVISGEKNDVIGSINMLNSDIKNLNSEANLIVNDYYIDNKTYEGDMLIKSSIIIIIVTLLNSICISKLWVRRKCKEVVIRLVCGAKRRDIFKRFYVELLVLSVISFFIAIIGQVILVKATNGFMLNMDIRMSFWNVILSLIVSVVVAFLTAIPSIKYIAEIQPIEFLREE